jgi:pyruvate/2-oxoglutarate/acetoin dehydrogenase E1 component
MRELAFVDAINEALREEMKRDKMVYLISEDVTVKQLERSRKGLQEEFGNERVLYGPIAETALLGSAFGSALGGMRPVAEIASINWITVCMDMIANHMSHYRYATGRGDIKLPIVVRTQAGNGGAAPQGPHHEQSLEAWFPHISGLKVVMPSNAYDAKGLLKAAIRDNNPVFFIEHRLLAWEKGDVPDTDYIVPLGKADVKRKGTDVTVATYSRDVLLALKAATEMEKQGISLEVIDLRTLRPLDEETLLASVKKTGRLIVAHEACKTGGFGAEVAAVVAEKGFQFLKAPIRRVASLDAPIPQTRILAGRSLMNERDIMIAEAELMGKTPVKR